VSTHDAETNGLVAQLTDSNKRALLQYGPDRGSSVAIRRSDAVVFFGDCRGAPDGEINRDVENSGVA
jgi:hypothetical protein